MAAPSPWLILRQAREALRIGRPDEARRLVEPLAADGYRKAVRLNREIARAFLTRAERHLRADNVEAAWADLQAAEALNTGEPGAVQLRQTLTRLGLAECRAALEAGNPSHVRTTAARLGERAVVNPEVERLVEVARDWESAADFADRGEFRRAADLIEACQHKVTPIHATGMNQFAAILESRRERFRTALSALNDAAEGRRWRDALQWADEALAAAPQHREARSVRASAWNALQPEPPTAPYKNGLIGHSDVPDPLVAAPIALTKAAPLPIAKPSTRAKAERHTTAGQALPRRFLLWIDGVGGYLVCMNSRVTFGQAVADGPVDVPLFAELSRLHAEISRDNEGYVMESAREVLVNGRAAPRTVLNPGDRLTLGPTCQMLFHQPVPISPSARLELVSGHRLPLAVDGVLLMAEALILGPGTQVHVPLPAHVPGNVVLFKGKDGLGVRFAGPFRVDSKPCEGKADLPMPCLVTCEHFTFALEPVGTRL